MIETPKATRNPQKASCKVTRVAGEEAGCPPQLPEDRRRGDELRRGDVGVAHAELPAAKEEGEGDDPR